MYKRYQIWDQKSDVYTPGGAVYTAAQWSAKFPWIQIPGAKMVIGGGRINGTLCEEYDSFVERNRKQGAPITDTMADEEILSVIEAFENTPHYDTTESSAEERIAAALEIANVMNLPTVNEDDPDEG